MADNQPDLSNVYQALRNADAAGDTAAAQKLANYIRSVQGDSAASAPSGGSEPAAPKPTAGQRARAALDDATSMKRIDAALNKDKVPQPAPTFKSAIQEIGANTAVGGVLGAVSPEILSAAGAAVSRIPEIGPLLGPALLEMGTAARAARLSAAATGALSGATSEAAGQAAQALGASKGTADAARLVAGAATPEIGLVASKAKGLYNLVGGLLGKDMSSAAVGKAKTALAGLTESGAPQHALHQALQAGADADIKSAQQEAERVMADARSRAADIGADDARAAQRALDDGTARAQSIVNDARKRATQLDKLSQGRMSTASKVLSQAEPALRQVGQPRELSDIGKELQSTVAQQHQAALQARSDAYNQLRSQRDNIVQGREAAGQSIDSTPSMIGLKREVDAALRPNKQGFETVVDPGVRKAYTDIQTALTRKAVPTGTLDKNGQPEMQQFKTSFEALDQVRRRLGDAVAGRDVEGYGAIGKDLAGKLYGKISKAQQEFVGEIDTPNGKENLQKLMQSTYHDASIGMRGFSTGAAGKATAIDRIDPERFAADPQTIPQQFFKSQQSVQDLRELTNPGLVDRAARSYSANQLRGMSSKQVNGWVQKNSDWIREVPGLSKDLQGYANRLSKIESTAGKVEKSAEKLQKAGGAELEGARRAAGVEREESIRRAGKIGEGSVATQARVLEQGEKAGREAAAQAAAPAEKLRSMLAGGERPEAVRDLLLNGKPEQTRLAARIASQTPQGQRQLEDSVRQITAQMNEKTLQKTWNERLKPMLQDGKMIPPERLKALDQDISRLLRAYQGKPPVGLVQKHITAVLAALPGAVSPRD